MRVAKSAVAARRPGKKAVENPLVPHERLRAMYRAMLEARMLETHLGAIPGGRRWREMERGEEACRVSTSIGLAEGDLVSDAGAGVTMDLLLGSAARLILRHADAQSSSKVSGSKRLSVNGTPGRRLPLVENGAERVRAAAGSAMALKTLRQPHTVVVYVRRAELTDSAWKEVLTFAMRYELPVLFVVLPAKDKSVMGRALSAIARQCGLPGIPVDANDAVALYRVAQEALGRTRVGDGPVLMECVPYAVEGARGRGADDPVKELEASLLERGIVTPAWVERTRAIVAKRLQ